MALGFTTRQRLDAILWGVESTPPIPEINKVMALQEAAIFYDLYDGNGSETTYTDRADLTVLESTLIATAAAIVLITRFIFKSSSDVQSTTSGPVQVTFRSDTLNWLAELLKELRARKKELEDSLELGEMVPGPLPGLFIAKVGACCDGDTNPCDSFSDYDPSKA